MIAMTAAANRMDWKMSHAGVQVPWLIYGTAWKQEHTADLVELAVSVGFCGIDTACQPRHYREDLVGEAIRRLAGRGIGRDELYLQTKFTPASGQDQETIPYDAEAEVARQVEQSFTVSLKNLGVEYVDTLILHSPLESYERTVEAWRAMEEIHRQGGARQLGISNCYSPSLLFAMAAEMEVKPAVLQNRFYRDTGYDRVLRRWCREQKVIYQSFWTLTANPHLLAAGPLRAIARKYRKTGEQVLLRFLSQVEVVPLTGTRSPRHMRDDLSIMDFSLSAEEVAMVNGLLS